MNLLEDIAWAVIGVARWLVPFSAVALAAFLWTQAGIAYYDEHATSPPSRPEAFLFWLATVGGVWGWYVLGDRVADRISD